MFGGSGFATDLAWQLKLPQILPRVREVRMKGRRKERGQVMNGVGLGGQKGWEKGKEWQERGNLYPPFCTKVVPLTPLWAGSVSNLTKYTDNNLLSAAATITSALYSVNLPWLYTCSPARFEFFLEPGDVYQRHSKFRHLYSRGMFPFD